MNYNIYKCPVCNQDLNKDVNSYSCSNSHSFDIARDGYLNLLLVNKKKSKLPGDNQLMIDGRSQFLSLGFYDFLASEIISILDQQFENQKITVLDAGCGEGYYINYIQEKNKDYATHGFDISKYAAKLASRKNSKTQMAVASVFDMPYRSESLDAIISIFSPISNLEFNRVLKSNGIAIVVTPGSEHLSEMASLIYKEFKPHIRDSNILESNSFEIIKRENITKKINLDSNKMINDLLKMTPYYWQVPLSKKSMFDSIEKINTTASFQISIFKKLV
jgi:23S rRNA (guanine745-N1)-methyltransferase